MQTSEKEPVWYRLHPTMMLFRMGRALPNLTLVFWSAFNGFRKESLVWLALAFFFMCLTMLGMVWRYISYRYALNDGHIVIHEGILSKKMRRIPVRRIHNINTSQGLFARIFRVMRLDIETAGGGSAEASMEALTAEAVNRIREYVRREKGRDQESASAESDRLPSAPLAFEPGPIRIIHQVGLKELFLAGATTSRLGIFAVLFLGLSQYAEFMDRDPIPDMSRNVSDYINSGANDHLLLTGILFFILLLFVAWLFNIGMAVVRWYHFTLSENGSDLNIRSGLFTIREYSMPVDKIQALQCVTSALRRPFHLFQLKVRSAGHVGVQEGRQRGESDLLVPITPRRRIGYFAGSVWPGADWDTVDWRPVHRFTRTRHFRILGFFFLVLWTAFVWWFHRDHLASTLYWAGLAIVLPVCWAVAHLTYKQAGYACDRDFIYIKTGFIGLHFWVIPVARVQNVAVSQTPFQRWRGLASLSVDIAGSGGGQDPVIPNIALATAWRLFNRIIQPIPRRKANEVDPELYGRAPGL